MKIAVVQFNPIVGDIAGNARRILKIAQEASAKGADLAVFPELCMVGYSHHDLLDNDYVVTSIEVATTWIHEHLPHDIAIILGTVRRNPSPHGKRLFNSAAFLESGKPARFVDKMLLPTYDLYDEYRYFEPAKSQTPIKFKGLKLGIHICEDMWNLEKYASYLVYERNPLSELIEKGAQVLINLSASPFSHGRHDLRTELIQDICAQHRVPFLMANQVGANTEMVFDGDSRVHAANGDLLCQAPSFEETVLYWNTFDQRPIAAPTHDRIQDIFDALVCGIREYDRKSGIFNKHLIGLSGGIDSAVTAALAVEAVGAHRVMGITMPSEYSSEGSVSDSHSLAHNLGIPCHTLPIRGAITSFKDMLAPLFDGTKEGLAEENIQARTRGLALMAVSNKFGHLLLSTGNKSEMAMGYATLYGDMAGGLAVLADVFKTDVYLLAEFINQRAGRALIPVSSIEKPPSAELRPDQRDQDSLPPYPVLDEILRLYIEERGDVFSICDQLGHEEDFVRDILSVVDRNEFKRKQAGPGLRVSKKAFGTGRRMPLVMKMDRFALEQLKQELNVEANA
ncbi:MAG: NAD+ synthase [Bacteroidetes bacterium]|nr:NAD+ synthase [Bacteroidota bacterium]